MTLEKPKTVKQLHEVAQYETLKAKLLTKPYAQHLTKTLAYWALTSEKRQPMALMGRTLGDLLHTPFEEIRATPGIGSKKICAYIQLLSRAVATDPKDLPRHTDVHANGANETVDTSAVTDGFNPVTLSEVTWEKWRSSVVRHGLGYEPLARFAPSLRNLTKVIWEMPLNTYINDSLDELRKKKTHGEKRVRAILDVFQAVHGIVEGMGSQPHLIVRIVPRRIDKVERWITETLKSHNLPSEEQIFENFTEPLLEQIRDDASAQIASLAERRLGVGCPMASVRQIARNMSLTRARVYQLLEEIHEILEVRWPCGRRQAYELRARLVDEATKFDPPRDLRQLLAAIDLFYPSDRQAAANRELSGDDNDNDDGPKIDTVNYRQPLDELLAIQPSR